MVLELPLTVLVEDTGVLPADHGLAPRNLAAQGNVFAAPEGPADLCGVVQIDCGGFGGVGLSLAGKDQFCVRCVDI